MPHLYLRSAREKDETHLKSPRRLREKEGASDMQMTSISAEEASETL